LGFRKPDAVNYRGVIKLVGDDGIFCTKQRLKQPTVGIEAGRIENGIFGFGKLAICRSSSL
jgi:hypothetical protein